MKRQQWLLVCLLSSLGACTTNSPPISGSVLGAVANGGENGSSTTPLIPDPPWRGTPLKVMGNTAFIDSSLPARMSDGGTKLPDYYQRLSAELSGRHPELDAQAAIQQGERYLLIYTQANTSVINKKYALPMTFGDPGTPIGDRSIKCGLKYIQGLEATVSSDEDMMLFAKLNGYAAQWNSTMKEACS